MKNEQTIKTLSGQIRKTCKRIESLTDDISGNESMPGDGSSDVYKDVILNELENVQILTLHLTKMVTEAAEAQNEDDSGGDSSFFPLELNHQKKRSQEDSSQGIQSETNAEERPRGSVGVVVISDGNILIGTRLSEPEIGLLCGPGGRTEEGETPEEAAIRLTKEQFGIKPIELIPVETEEDGEVEDPLILYVCTEFSGKPECKGGDVGNARFISLEDFSKMSSKFCEQLKAGIMALLSVIEPENADGGDGSGNWGHEGRPGKVGGSASGGGVHNRMGDKKSGYTSFSKKKKKLAKPHEADLSEFYKSPNGAVLTTKSGVFKKRSYTINEGNGESYIQDEFVNMYTGQVVDARVLWKELSSNGELCSFAIPDSENKNYRKFKVMDDGRFSQERKEYAFTTDDPKAADDIFRQKTGEIWSDLDDKSKSSLADYTGDGYTDINSGLRKNDLTPRLSEEVDCITKAISQSKLDEDVWLYRGIDSSGAEKMLGIPEGSLSSIDANALVGRTCRDNAFMSCGTAKYTGFTKEVNFTIYCPVGTEALYAEPFSVNGGGDGAHWDGVKTDGKSDQMFFSGELETILQRGTELQIVSAEKQFDTLELVAQVIGQNYKPMNE